MTLSIYPFTPHGRFCLQRFGTAGRHAQLPEHNRAQTLMPGQTQVFRPMRADLVIKEMTSRRKSHSCTGRWLEYQRTSGSNGGAGWMAAFRASAFLLFKGGLAYESPRRAIRPLFYRVAQQLAQPLLGSASRFEYGALIGREARAQGYNMSLGGGVNMRASRATAAPSSTKRRSVVGRHHGRQT